MATCIAGVHRSGTSMVAKLLHLCGMNLGDPSDLIVPSEANPDGYWENRTFVELNDQIISARGGDWSTPPELPDPSSEEWETDGALAQLVGEARVLLAGFSGTEPWGWKDPRNSFTLPFWSRILPDLSIVVCVRNPLEVALSLERVGACGSTEDGLELWRIYNARILQTAPADRTIFTHSAAYFDDPTMELRRLTDRLGLKVSKEALAESASAVRPVLRHSRFTRRDLSRFARDRELVGLYARLCDSADWQDDGSAAVVLPPARRTVVAADAPRAPSHSPADLDAVLDLLVREVSRLAVTASSITQRVLDTSREVGDVRRLAEQTAAASAEALGALRDAEADRSALLSTLSRLEGELARLSERVEAVSDGIEDVGEAAVGGLGERAKCRQLVRAIRRLVLDKVPAGATVLVVSKGDERLVRLPGRHAGHFPQNETGVYSGYHPASSLAAIAHLEAMRAHGAEFLVVPEPYRWWLDHYHELDRHLTHQYRMVAERPGIGVLFDLRPAEEESPWAAVRDVVADCAAELDREPPVLDWADGVDVASALPESTVFSPPNRSELLPYLDETVEVVVIDDTASSVRRVEANRVANTAVVRIPHADRRLPVTVNWKSRASTARVPVSVIMPVFGAPASAPVSSLLEALPRGFEGEIVAVHASGDPVPKALERWSSEADTNVLRDCPAIGPVSTWWTSAANTALGQVLVFVGKDVLLLPGWLTPLVRTLRLAPRAGVVGGRIVTGQGRLLHAGATLGAEDRLTWIGAGDERPDAPEYLCTRQVPCLGPWLLATDRQLLTRAGGLGSKFESLDHVAADYCLRIARLGRGAYYQPESVAVLLGPDPGPDIDVPEGLASALLEEAGRVVRREGSNAERDESVDADRGAGSENGEVA